MLFGEGPQIKNIAADLNKLFRQGSLLNQIGQTVEGDSTADQGTSDLLAARDPVIHEISVGMSGEQSARYTVSGTPPLSLPNSLGKPLKAWSVDLLPYQEGTGDPSPDNVRPIHGTDKVTITTAGKNLLDPTKRQNLANNIYWYYNTSGLLLMAGVTYTFSISSASAQNSIEEIGGPQLAVNYGKTRLTYTPSTDIYVWINTYFSGGFLPPSGGTSEVQCQLEFGSIVTDYAPYVTPSQTVLTLPQTVYTGTIGSEGGESRWGEVDLGTLNWGRYLFEEVYCFYVVIPNMKMNNPQGICSMYNVSSVPKSPRYLVDGEVSLDNGTHNGYAYIRDDAYSDAASFKAAVTGHKLVYELVTPIQFPLTAPTIPTPTGTATTWATAEDGTVDSMEVTYVGKA